ncbi:MAG: hypothetical protein HY812_07855 [Planctomycetes bacterium]|nr:hypothetical protein [Planctomycetota bacterium]
MIRLSQAAQAALGVALLAFSACTVDRTAERTPIPHVTVEQPATFDSGYQVGEAYVLTEAGDVTVGERLSDFCLGIAAKGGQGVSVGCLPVVTYDLRRVGPWVSELGMRLADDVAERLKAAGYAGEVLNTPEMDARIQRSGLDKALFANVTAVTQHGAGLGLGVVACGTLKRENSLGVAGRDVITLDLTALDVGSGSVLARVTFEVASDRAGNRAFFELAQRESLWLPEGR